MSIEQSVLTSMDPRKDYTAQDLAEVMDLAPSQVSAALRRLARGG